MTGLTPISAIRGSARPKANSSSQYRGVTPIKTFPISDVSDSRPGGTVDISRWRNHRYLTASNHRAPDGAQDKTWSMLCHQPSQPALSFDLQYKRPCGIDA